MIDYGWLFSKNNPNESEDADNSVVIVEKTEKYLEFSRRVRLGQNEFYDAAFTIDAVCVELQLLNVSSR